MYYDMYELYVWLIVREPGIGFSVFSSDGSNSNVCKTLEDAIDYVKSKVG